MRKLIASALAALLLLPAMAGAQRYSNADGKLRVALAQQPFSPNGTVPGPRTMANGGIQQILAGLGATVRIQEAALTPEENTEYGGWKRLGLALGHYADLVSTNEREGYFTDDSAIEQLSVDDLRHATPAVFAQLDRLARLTDKIYVHIDMDVLDPREVMAHQQSAQRAVERTTGRSVREGFQSLPHDLCHRLRHGSPEFRADGDLDI